MSAHVGEQVGTEVVLPVLVLDEEHGDGVAERLASWFRAGLLIPYLLVQPDGQVHPTSAVPGLTGAGPRQDPRTVLSELGVQRLILLVVCGPLGPSDAAVRVLDQLDAAVIESRSVTRVWLYGVREAEKAQLGGGQPDPRALHLVVSVEDHLDDRGVLMPESESPLPERLAVNAALVAGLFVVQDDAPADMLAPTGTVQYRLVRGFGRLALGAPAIPVCIRTDTVALRTDAGKVADLSGGVAASDPPAVVASVARQFVTGCEQGTLRHQPYKRVPPPEPERVTLRKALQMAWEFLVTALRGAVVDAARRRWEQAIDRVERRAQLLIFGEDSAYRIALRNGEPVPALPNASDLASQLLSDDDISVHVAAIPTVCQEYRRIAFALVDAGRMPDYVNRPRHQNDPMLVTDPALIAPLPSSKAADDAASPAPDWASRACDPRARKVAWVEAGGQLAAFPHSAAAAAAVDPAPAGGTGAEAGTPADDAQKSAVLALLREDLAGRADSFCWRVTDTVDEEDKKAAAAMTGAAARLRDRLEQAGAEDEDDVRSRRRKRKRKWLRWLRIVLVLVFVAAVVAMPALALAIGIIGLVTWTILQVIVLIGAAVAALMRCLRWAQRRFQENNRRDTMLHEWEQDVAAARHEAGEFRRLDSAYRQLVDWSNVVAEVTHRPFGEAEAGGPPSDAVAVPGGPTSWVCGQGLVGESRLRRLTHACAKAVFTRGWLTAVFDERTRALTERERWEEGATDEAASLEADYDPTGTGRILKLADDLRENAGTTEDNLARPVAEVLHAQSIGEVFDGVQFGNGVIADVATFLAPCSATPESASPLDRRLLPIEAVHSEGVTRVDRVLGSGATSADDPLLILHKDGQLAALAVRLDVGHPTNLMPQLPHQPDALSPLADEPVI